MTQLVTFLSNVESFYHLRNGLQHGQLCNGMACFVARDRNPDRWSVACSQQARLYCLGKCYAAPAAVNDESHPPVRSHAKESIVLKRILEGGAQSLQKYVLSGGYRTLQLARSRGPEEIIREMEISGLRGRGGAGFPTGKKWHAVQSQFSSEKFVIANGDEGDPGAFIDRMILEEDPHSLIEALTIAAYAVGASKGFIYIRNEYPKAIQVVSQAIEEARAARVLDSFDLEVVTGKGSYVCGEETALINSIEHNRGEAKLRPPYPHQSGLHRMPTLVNNIETLANVCWIVQNGGAAYQELGFSKSRGTKVVSLNSLFTNPGLYEIDFGIPVRSIIEQIGGGLRSGKLKGVLIGGPLAGIIPPNLLDISFGFEELGLIGAAVGHGGVIAFDESISIVELMHHVFEFGSFESCGKCMPCRAGTSRIHEILDEILSCGATSIRKKQELSEILSLMQTFSLCGFGSGLADFARSVLHYYGEELRQCFL